MDDKRLVQQAAAGDTAAFETLVERYQQQVYHLALRMVNNEADAQDLAQDAFVRAWRGLDSFQFTSQFSTWLYRLTSNICIDFLRAQKRRKVVSLTMLRDDEDSQWDLPDSDPLPERGPVKGLRRPGPGIPPGADPAHRQWLQLPADQPDPGRCRGHGQIPPLPGKRTAAKKNGRKWELFRCKRV